MCREAGHPARAALDDRCRSPHACVARRRRRATGSRAACRRDRRDGSSRSAADRARVRSRPRVARRQAARPRDVVGVDVEHAGRRIERRPAPLGAAVEAGKTTVCLPTESGTNEPAVLERARTARRAHWCASGVRVVSMLSVSTCRANGFGLDRNRLRVGRHLTWDGARGNFRYSIGKSGLPFARSNTKTIAVLGRLRDGVDRAAVAPERDQAGRRRRIAIPDVVADELEVPDALAGCRVRARAGSWRRGCRPRRFAP